MPASYANTRAMLVGEGKETMTVMNRVKLMLTLSDH